MTHTKILKLIDATPLSIVEYANYRISRILKKIPFIPKQQILRILCEAGPGNIRFDPMLLEEIIKKRFFDMIVSYQADRAYFSSSDSKLTQDDKEQIDTLYRKYCTEVTKINTNALISRIEAHFKINALEIRQDYLEAILESKNKRILLHYSTGPAWIYLNYRPLQQLIEKSIVIGASPLILSYKIHGSCYQFFKKVGIFGWQCHTLFRDSAHEELKKFSRFEKYEAFSEILPMAINSMNQVILPNLKKIDVNYTGEFLNDMKLVASQQYGIPQTRKYISVLEKINALKLPSE